MGYYNHRRHTDWFKVAVWIIGILVSIGWYGAVGTIAFNYIAPDKSIAARQACIENFEDNYGQQSRYCTFGEYDLEPAIWGGIFWPVSVPVIFGIRNPLWIALGFPSALGMFFGVMGVNTLISKRKQKKRKLEKEKALENERKLKAAEEYLRKEAPEFAQQLADIS